MVKDYIEVNDVLFAPQARQGQLNHSISNTGHNPHHTVLIIIVI